MCMIIILILYGKLVFMSLPQRRTAASRAHCQRQVDALWDEVKRFENPHNYYVDLSQKLWDIKHGLLSNPNGQKK